MSAEPAPGEPPSSAETGVGGRIRRYRLERQLNLSQLAEQAGVSKGYLSALENNDDTGPQSRRPSAETLYAIAKVLGVTMSDLLGRRLLTTGSDEIPESLREFARLENLPEADVIMLGAIKFRGEAPRTIERWRYIYTAIRTSESIDK
jgi:transcriptional regulator with XRE-family HTH domain